MVVAVAGSIWVGTNVADTFGFIWFICCAVVAGVFGTAILRFMSRAHPSTKRIDSVDDTRLRPEEAEAETD